MKEISEKQYEKLSKSCVSLKHCPACGWGLTEVVIKLNTYGKTGAQVRCSHCGNSTNLQGISDCFSISGGGRDGFGTPTTFKSVVRGVFKACSIWNVAASKR